MLTKYETAHDAAKAFRDGKIVHTIEMGWLGPGYEQAIQVTAFCIIEEIDPDELPALIEDGLWDRIKATKKYPDGLSCAQFGAAANLAYRALKHGWQGMLDSAKAGGVEDDRFIMVDRNWAD
jgi:hypothetical protein